MRQGDDRPQQQEGHRGEPVKVSHVGAPVRDGPSQTGGASTTQPGRLPRSLSGIAAEAGSVVLASALREAGPMLQQPGVSDLVEHGSGPLDILAAAHHRLNQPSPFAQVATSYLRRRGAPEPEMGASQAEGGEVDFAELRVSWAAGVVVEGRGLAGTNAACDLTPSTIQAWCGIYWAVGGLGSILHRSLSWKLKVSQACICLRLRNAWQTVVKLTGGQAACKQ